jgi:hypothetical protein
MCGDFEHDAGKPFAPQIGDFYEAHPGRRDSIARVGRINSQLQPEMREDMLDASGQALPTRIDRESDLSGLRGIGAHPIRTWKFRHAAEQAVRRARAHQNFISGAQDEDGSCAQRPLRLDHFHR